MLFRDTIYKNGENKSTIWWLSVCKTKNVQRSLWKNINSRRMKTTTSRKVLDIWSVFYSDITMLYHRDESWPEHGLINVKTRQAALASLHKIFNQHISRSMAGEKVNLFSLGWRKKCGLSYKVDASPVNTSRFEVTLRGECVIFVVQLVNMHTWQNILFRNFARGR